MTCSPLVCCRTLLRGSWGRAEEPTASPRPSRSSGLIHRLIDRDLIMIAQAIRHRGPTSVPIAPITPTRHILATKLTYIDHPSFRDPSARHKILAPLAQLIGDWVSRRWQPPDRLPPIDRALGAAVPVSRARSPPVPQDELPEVPPHQLKEQLDPDRPDAADIDEIERLRVRGDGGQEPDRRDEPGAGRHDRQDVIQGRLDLAECVSDGNLAPFRPWMGLISPGAISSAPTPHWAIRNVLARKV